MNFAEALQAISVRYDCDVICYYGRIDRRGYSELTSELAKKKRRPNAFLVLGSTGGDAHAAFRIARAIRHNYKDADFRVFIPGLCKSAATLVCIGASSLTIADRGELGPLDVQVSNPEEVFGQNSGLDLLKALTHIRESAYDCFKSNLIEIRDLGLGTRVASEIASKLAVGLHAPIFEQIDPIRLGEVQRLMEIAIEYGTRLNKYSSILKEGESSLNRLVTQYPSHNFVIDRKEARELFKDVASPSDEEMIVANELEHHLVAGGVSFVFLFPEPTPAPAPPVGAAPPAPADGEPVAPTDGAPVVES